MTRRVVCASACDVKEVCPVCIAALDGTALKSVDTFVVDHNLPNDKDSVDSVSCDERGPAGKACAYFTETASGQEVIRGASRRVRDEDGEAITLTAPRLLPPSATLSSAIISGEDSRRAVA